MAGTFYWVVYPSSGTDHANSSAGADYIIAGQDGAGVTATASGSVADIGQASPVDAASAATGLTAGTAYDVAWTWKDGATYATSPYVVVASFKTHYTASGALVSGAATIAGAAVHFTLHASSGALSAQAAVVAGAAVHPHTSTGALSAQAADIDGSAAHLTLHATTGALAAGAATVAGAALHPHTTTGALSAGAAVVAGSAAHLTLHTSTGALESGASVVAGDAEHSVDGAFDADGALSAQAAAVVGAAQRFALHTTIGALAAGAATVAGSATRLALHTAEGAIAAGAATVAGSAAHVLTHDATGELEAGEAALSAAALTFEGGGASAASVWNYVLSNGLTAEETLVAILECCQTGRMARVEKLLRNKQITDPVTGKLTLFDDDDVTPLLEGDLYEDADGTQPYRGQGAERRERLV